MKKRFDDEEEPVTSRKGRRSDRVINDLSRLGTAFGLDDPEVNDQEVVLAEYEEKQRQIRPAHSRQEVPEPFGQERAAQPEARVVEELRDPQPDRNQPTRPQPRRNQEVFMSSMPSPTEYRGLMDKRKAGVRDLEAWYRNFQGPFHRIF